MSRAEPNLRQLVAFTNTLDMLTEWTIDYMQRRALDQLHGITQNGQDEPDIAEGYMCEVQDADDQAAETADTSSSKRNEQYIVTTSEVTDTDEDDDWSDDEEVDYSASTINEELKGNIELARVDGRLWRGVKFHGRGQVADINKNSCEGKGFSVNDAMGYRSDSESDFDSDSDRESDSENGHGKRRRRRWFLHV